MFPLPRERARVRVVKRMTLSSPDALPHSEFLNSCLVELDPQPRSIGYAHPSRLSTNRLGNRIPKRCAFFDDEFEQAQRIGHTRQEVQGCRDIQISRKTVIDDLEPAIR